MVKEPFEINSYSELETPLPIQVIDVTEQVYLSEKEVIEYKVEVTHYCLCVRCTGKWSAQHPTNRSNPNFKQRTASGSIPTPYRTAAADPAYWRPDLSRAEFFALPVEERSFTLSSDNHEIVYVIEDTGSAVRGPIIDILVSSHEEAIQRGRINATLK